MCTTSTNTNKIQQTKGKKIIRFDWCENVVSVHCVQGKVQKMTSLWWCSMEAKQKQPTFTTLTTTVINNRKKDRAAKKWAAFAFMMLPRRLVLCMSLCVWFRSSPCISNVMAFEIRVGTDKLTTAPTNCRSSRKNNEIRCMISDRFKGLDTRKSKEKLLVMWSIWLVMALKYTQYYYNISRFKVPLSKMNILNIFTVNVFSGNFLKIHYNKWANILCNKTTAQVDFLRSINNFVNIFCAVT